MNTPPATQRPLRFYPYSCSKLRSGYAACNFGREDPRNGGVGDSTSDTGNAYAILGVLAEAPFEPIPPAPYAISEGRFSNEKVWIEQLAKSLRIRKGA